MILARPVSRWIGKTVVSVEPIQGRDKETLFMTQGVRITFTDGSVLLIKADHYGRECYISEHGPEDAEDVKSDG